MLLKGKEAELRAARQAAALSPEHAARVAQAEAAAAAALQERDQVPIPRNCETVIMKSIMSYNVSALLWHFQGVRLVRSTLFVGSIATRAPKG